jgi:tetratricopeptide (TPR) repeat protein
LLSYDWIWLTRDEGGLAEQMGNLDDAMASYERALRTNPNSIPAMNAMSSVLRTREDFPKAAEYLNAILKLDERNGEAWGCLGAYAREKKNPSMTR